MRGPLKKATKCVGTMERLSLGSLNALFAGRVQSGTVRNSLIMARGYFLIAYGNSCGRSLVALILGASIVSPREVYVIDFPNNDTDTASEEDPPKLTKEKIMRLCAQKLIRAMIATSAQRITWYDRI